jgi:CHAD domain-containing protein
VREVETKYRASRDFVLPDLDGRVDGVAAVEAVPALRLTAVYHDTADLRLAREGITLRRRTGGTDDGWHLKLPVLGAGAGVRDEIQIPDTDPAIPEGLSSLVTAYVRFGQLQPAATLVTERVTWMLRDADGAPLAEVVDDRVTVEGTGHVAAGFREIEVEDKGGGPELLGAVGSVLQTSGAVSGEFMPKLVRALGARATAPPDPPFPTEIGPDDPATAVLATFLRTHTRRLLVEDVRFRLHGDDTVHQMRVASRRMRSLLRTFQPVLDVEWSEPLREELAWLGTELAGARDAEVLRARLDADLESLPSELVLGPVKARLTQVIGGRFAESAAEAEKTVHTERYVSLLERLVDGAWQPHTTPEANRPARDVVPELIRQDWRRLAKRVATVRQTEVIDDYHRVRIAAKKLRYACEAVAPAFGKPAARLAEQAERVQELLGEHQDAVVSLDTLRTIATSPTGRSVGFTLGLLYAREEARARGARAIFAELWPEVARRRYRDWLAV